MFIHSVRTVLSRTLLRAINIRTEGQKSLYLCLYLVAVVAGHKGTYQVARKKGKALRRGSKVAGAELFHTERQERSLWKDSIWAEIWKKWKRRSHTGLREKVSDKRKSRRSSVVYSRNSQRAWAWNVEEGVGKGRQRDEREPSRIFLPVRWGPHGWDLCRRMDSSDPTFHRVTLTSKVNLGHMGLEWKREN